MRRPLPALALCLTAAVVLHSPVQAAGDAAWFRGVGAAPSGTVGISADGQVVAGNCSVNGVARTFRWESIGGLQTLPAAPGQTYAALGISGDGTTIVGVSYLPDGAFRWVAPSAAEMIPAANAYAASFDGSVVVGEAYSGCGTIAYRWTSADGVVPLGTLTGQCDGGYSSARSVSADGSIVVGVSDPFVPSVHHVEAFRWTNGSGMMGLGLVAGQTARSFAYAVSADGAVVVGGSDNVDGEAFRWTAATGMRGIGDLPGEPFNSRALAVSGDGVVVVGAGNLGGYTEAMVWTAATGMRTVEEVLEGEHGLNVTGWRFTFATGVSSDGRTIVGQGLNPCGVQEGWVAHLGDRVCSVDFNGDGALALQDVFAFLIAWFDGDDRADFNGCGLAVQDIFDYLAAWFVGC